MIAKAQHTRDAYQAWLAASYNSFAFHDAEKMPDAPELDHGGPAPEVNTPAEMARVRAWMKSLAEPPNGG